MSIFTENSIKEIENVIDKNKETYESNEDLIDAAIYKANTPADFVCAIIGPVFGYDFYEIRNKSFEDMSDDELDPFCNMALSFMAAVKLCNEN